MWTCIESRVSDNVKNQGLEYWSCTVRERDGSKYRVANKVNSQEFEVFDHSVEDVWLCNKSKVLGKGLEWHMGMQNAGFWTLRQDT